MRETWRPLDPGLAAQPGDFSYLSGIHKFDSFDYVF